MSRTRLIGVLALAGLLALGGPAPAAVTDAQVRDAIAKGVAYLKSRAGTDGFYGEGDSAIAGLAMLEAKVDPADPAVQGAARRVRSFVARQNQTYQLALDIMFLDRLGEDADRSLIQSMGVRLLYGQSRTGGWSYDCPSADKREQDRITKLINSPPPAGANPPAGLDADVAEVLDNPTTRLVRSTNPPRDDDNSNTQFAILGLWAARRYGIPVDKALEAVDQRFRASQAQAGGWGYIQGQAPNGSMTCAGLLALAVGIGHQSERSLKGARSLDAVPARPSAPPAPAAKDPMKDRAVVAGRLFLDQVIKSNNLSPTGPSLGVPAVTDVRESLYFLWSLERVCVVYGWTTVGGINWHLWGTEAILRAQRKDGSWPGAYKEVVDTSFAVMFLSRANLVKDLTNMLDRRLKSGPRPYLPPSKPVDPASEMASADAAKLGQELAKAPAARQAELIKEYATGKGSKYTEALATAIPDLPAELQKSARRALADRLGKFSAATLRLYMQQDNAELRRAAAIAAAEREEQELIPDLVELLADREDIVVRGARLALKSLTEQDFGPALGADEAARKKAIADWKAWLKTRPGR